MALIRYCRARAQASSRGPMSVDVRELDFSAASMAKIRKHPRFG